MNALRLSLVPVVCLLMPLSAFASDWAITASWNSQPGASGRYARRCLTRVAERGAAPVGTLLWGTKRSWSAEKTDEWRSVLVSLNSDKLLMADAHVKALRLLKGLLVAMPDKTPFGVVGTVLQGTSSDGKSVDVAICGAEPMHDAPEVMWYRIEAWNPVTKEWENPCAADGRVSDPRAMMVNGVWNASGEYRDAPGKLTLACEFGAISKCISWGYRPWEVRNGKSLASLHQACTRMARADYCGNGKNHTQESTTIDIYDALGVLSRTTETSASWDPGRASFEAAWAPDGASCLSRTRDGRAVETVLAECPGRFRMDRAVDLGEGDFCTARREGVSAGTVMLRNRSYESP